MKKFAMLATAAVLSAAAAPSYAMVYTVTSSLTGSFVATGFLDADPNTYNINFRDLNGTVNVYVPPAGTYTVGVGGSALLDFVPGNNPSLPAPWDIAFSTPSISTIFTGLLGGTAATGMNTFTFTPGTFGANDGAALGSGFFNITYDGQTTSGVLNALSLLTGVAVTDPSGSGNIGISYTLYSDGFSLAITETATNWPGFGFALAGIDSVFGASTPNYMDANFLVRDLQASISAVPEPATLTLLGLGLAGLGAMRRRKQA